MTEKLSKATWFKGRRGPVVLVIMDGVGFGKYPEGDAVASAKKPTLDWLLATCPNTRLKAHGQAVGLPSDADMGNSEVGHNVIGCGRVFDQGAKLVSASIASGKMFEGRLERRVRQCSGQKQRCIFSACSLMVMSIRISTICVPRSARRPDGAKNPRPHLAGRTRCRRDLGAGYVIRLRNSPRVSGWRMRCTDSAGGGWMHITMNAMARTGAW